MSDGVSIGNFFWDVIVFARDGDSRYIASPFGMVISGCKVET